MNRQPAKIPYSCLGHLSVGCFILAGLTGFLYRLGLIGWLPGGWGLQNIRHAHSHLMFFGWAVPFPMYILWSRIRQTAGENFLGTGYMQKGISGGLLFGLLAYPFFLFYGYQPVELGAISLPLSVIFSGLVMVSWYGYIWGYMTSRHRLDRNSRPWFDGALLLLFFCSLGAWGIALVQAWVPTHQLLMKGLTHFFLATFTEGWVVLVLLAVLVSNLPLETEDWRISPSIPLSFICIGAPLTFPFGISESLLSPFLLISARIGGMLSAIGLAIVLITVGQTVRWKSSIWKWPLALLALKSAMQLIASIVPVSFWITDHGLRILYLHVILLGAFTVAMSGWLQQTFEINKGYVTGVAAAIGLTLGSLILPTQLWPAGWSGLWIFYVLAGAALLPILALSVQWIRIILLPKTVN